MTKGPDPPRRALGRGLSALLPSKPTSIRAIDLAPPAPQPDGLLQLPVEAIDPNPTQPRTVFEADRLSELAQSIRTHGVIQPLIVQRTADRYQLVAGERRWRAAKLAGLEYVPAILQDTAPDRLLEVALIENIQREDLNPIEVAHALDRLTREMNLSHEEIGNRTGKDRTTVTNLIRLLKLPADIQRLVAERRLSMGQARAILALPTEELQRDVAEKAAAQGMSVRQVERLVTVLTQQMALGADKPEPKTPSPPADPNVAAAVRELEAVLGTRVRITAQSADRGRIEIEYYSFEDLDRIFNLIVATQN